MSAMKEYAEILEAVNQASAAGEPAALATIIAVRGSTYRREGARLLVCGSGRLVGNISGGCLEADVADAAGEVMGTGTPKVLLYDLTADDDAVWGLGLGCNGAIEVFVEVAGAGDVLWEAVRGAMEGAEAVAVATVVAGAGALQTGSRMAVWPDGRSLGSLCDPGGDSEGDEAVALVRAALAGLRSGCRRVATPQGAARIFVEVMRPPLRLVVCGAGHDAVPVVRLGAQLGWRVLVLDRREGLLSTERFPGAVGFVHAEFSDARDAVRVDRHTCVLVMTHNYLHDKELLRAFLPSDAGYIGVLGPRARTEKILRELRGAGVQVAGESEARLFGPVGLDIGGETPDEIAISVVGEILAAARGRRGGFLRERHGPIHAEPAADR